MHSLKPKTRTLGIHESSWTVDYAKRKDKSTLATISNHTAIAFLGVWDGFVSCIGTRTERRLFILG